MRARNFIINTSYGVPCNRINYLCHALLYISTDWRPRRSMVFCSWGAEEYGIIGSYEWTQQFAKVLSQRAVAYLNVDVAVGGKNQITVVSPPRLSNLFQHNRKSNSLRQGLPDAETTTL